MSNKNATGFESLKELIPVLVLCATLAAVICLPLRIMAYGYIPSDDAMRHAAKVISQKSWDQILVVRPEFKMDSHPGWHAVLGAIHRSTGCNQDTLLFFSVVGLFILFCAIPIFFIDYPETWLAALLAMAVLAPTLMMRLFLGRPYIFSMSVLLLILFLWQSLKRRKTPVFYMALFAMLVALATWIHASWYLFALPAACFFMAREREAGVRFAISTAVGVAIGACLTGHPLLFLKQTVTHAILAFGNASAGRLLVSEFQPFNGEGLVVLAVLILLVWRKARGKWENTIVYNPVFILAVTGWALGFVAIRFWTDWGFPAALVWITAELYDAYTGQVARDSIKRGAAALAISAALFLAVSSDLSGRWTNNLTIEYLSADNKEQAEWLPEPGGIVYSNSMEIFYQTFFKNPKAPWRYMLGFEPAMMPPEDLAIYRKIQWNYETSKAFEPWVKKMRPEDRLILQRAYGQEPNIKGLDWKYVATNIWIGKLPKQK